MVNAPRLQELAACRKREAALEDELASASTSLEDARRDAASDAAGMGAVATATVTTAVELAVAVDSLQSLSAHVMRHTSSGLRAQAPSSLAMEAAKGDDARRSAPPTSRLAAVAQRSLQAPPAVITPLLRGVSARRGGVAAEWEEAVASTRRDAAVARGLGRWCVVAAGAVKELSSALEDEAGREARLGWQELVAVRARCAEAEAAAAGMAVELSSLKAKSAASASAQDGALATLRSESAAMRAEAKALREDNQLLVERDGRLRRALMAAADAQERAEAGEAAATARGKELEDDLRAALVALLRAQNKRAEEMAASSEAKAEGSASVLEELRQVQQQLHASQQAAAAGATAAVEAQEAMELRRVNVDLRHQLAHREKELRQLKTRLNELRGVDVYSGTLARIVSTAKAASDD